MKTRRRQTKLLALLFMLAAPGCASMQQRVTASENRSSTIEAQVADLQANQQNIIVRLTQLREDLEAALDPVRAQSASGGGDLRALQLQVSTLQQQVALLTDQLAAASALGASGAGGVGTAMPPAAGAGSEPASAGGEATPGGAATAGVAAGGGATASSPADTLFNNAYRDYTGGHFVVAISGFEEFVNRFPDAARAADAVYWTAESLAAQDLHVEARNRFLAVAERYPDAAKVPDALLRAALEAVELGEVDDANRELRALIEAYGQSDAALIGCMQLDRLGQTLPSGCR